MTTSTGSNNSRNSRESGCLSVGERANWSVANILAMVIGFIAFWPFGLFMVYWILSGRRVQDLPQAARAKYAAFKGKRPAPHSETDNSVFEEYQQTQWDRIDEIREEIRQRSQRFQQWRADARRRADEKEFNDFMSSSPASER